MVENLLTVAESCTESAAFGRIVYQTFFLATTLSPKTANAITANQMRLVGSLVLGFVLSLSLPLLSLLSSVPSDELSSCPSEGLSSFSGRILTEAMTDPSSNSAVKLYHHNLVLEVLLMNDDM